MKINALILDACHGCGRPSIVNNFSIMATAEVLEVQTNDVRPRILIMYHCDLCGHKFKSKMNSLDFTVIE